MSPTSYRLLYPATICNTGDKLPFAIGSIAGTREIVNENTEW